MALKQPHVNDRAFAFFDLILIIHRLKLKCEQEFNRVSDFMQQLALKVSETSWMASSNFLLPGRIAGCW
jgi:hypothetical protein